MILDGKGLTHHLTKEAKASDGNFTTWKPTDATVKAWLIGSMKSKFLNKYLLLPTTKTVWDKFNKSCLQQSNDRRIYDLTIRIALVKQGNRKVQMYLAELEAPWQELDHFHGATLDECVSEAHAEGSPLLLS